MEIYLVYCECDIFGMYIMNAINVSVSMNRWVLSIVFNSQKQIFFSLFHFLLIVKAKKSKYYIFLNIILKIQVLLLYFLFHYFRFLVFVHFCLYIFFHYFMFLVVSLFMFLHLYHNFVFQNLFDYFMLLHFVSGFWFSLMMGMLSIAKPKSYTKFTIKVSRFNSPVFS